MLKATRIHILLLLIFIFAFVYRLIFMLWSTFPPGADIGLHSSVIYSITQSGNTNFLWDYYQMGGGTSLTFPGYHIFAASIILMTGMPNYVAQAVIAALFSSLIVLAAYLVTRAAWTESGALIIAFLVALSRFDMEMLAWGGYPNVITLLLIPLTLYLYLQKDRFSLFPFAISTSILAGSIFLTHSLSSVVFVTIVAATVLLILIVPKTLGTSRKQALYWILPIFGGVILVSPFLAEAIPTYLTANSAFTGTADINSALLSTRILPLDLILPLFVIVVLFFFLSKEYRGRFFSLAAIVFFLWLLVPLILTQGYLYGLFVDYNRFLYFLILPVLVLLGLYIDHGSLTFAKAIETLRVLTGQIQKTRKVTHKRLSQISRFITRKSIYAGFVLGIVLIIVLVFPIFMAPWQASSIQSFYQVMDNPGYQAIQWIRQNTPTGSVFVSDALYGWWLGGFAQRPTLSAVDPQYLTVARELYPAKNASLLLDTDYMIDNGYVQVREDGGYVARHNPEILANLNWTYFPYSFFDFDSNQVQIEYQVNGTVHQVYLDQLSVLDMRMEQSPDSATIIVTKGNNFFNYTQLTTVISGSRFVNMTAKLDSSVTGVQFDYVSSTVLSKGTVIQLTNNTVGLIDEGVKALGQLIFIGNQTSVNLISDQNPCILNIEYTLGGESQGQIQMLGSAYSVTDDSSVYQNQAKIEQYFDPIISNNLNSPNSPVGNLAITTFNYQTALQQYSVSYIANREFDLNPKFENDPTFSLVFINNEVAIFKVKTNIDLGGR